MTDFQALMDSRQRSQNKVTTLETGLTSLAETIGLTTIEVARRKRGSKDTEVAQRMLDNLTTSYFEMERDLNDAVDRVIALEAQLSREHGW
jgi:multidrug resistance efflux pump